MARDISRMKVFMPEQAETIENAGMEDSTEALTGGHNMAELYLRTQLYPPSCDSLVGVGQKAWNEAAYSQTSVRGEVGLAALVWECEMVAQRASISTEQYFGQWIDIWKIWGPGMHSLWQVAMLVDSQGLPESTLCF
jgi:hypothetical protein